MPIGEPNRFHRPHGSGARNTQEKICLIVNPRAGAGRAGAQIDTLKRLAERAFEQWEIQLTEAPGHATHLAKEAAEQGFDLIAAVGGDGTCHEVVNGLFIDGKAIRKKSAFTVIPFGTGSDLVRSLQIPKSTQEALWIAATGVSLPSDIGWAEVTTEDGPHGEAFINVASFGASATVARRANEGSKRFGGTATFMGATLRTLLDYEPNPVTVTFTNADGEHTWSESLMAGFIANGHYCGGGMRVGPNGSMQDGSFELCLLEPTSLAQQILDLRHLYDGQIHKSKGMLTSTATTVSADSDHPIAVELDGETSGSLPARFDIKQGALTMRGGWSVS
jgi:YegS/Rv2252/BmrU family lipid kinase